MHRAVNRGDFEFISFRRPMIVAPSGKKVALTIRQDHWKAASIAFARASMDKCA